MIPVLTECFSQLPQQHANVLLFSVSVYLSPKDCQSPCSECTSLTACTACVSSYSLYGSQCLLSCPITMFSSNNVCKSIKISIIFYLIISKTVHLIVLLVLLMTLVKSALKDLLSPTLFAFSPQPQPQPQPRPQTFLIYKLKKKHLK